jgi:hypothetical protein
MMIYPAVSMGSYIMALFDTAGSYFRLLLNSLGNSVKRELHLMLVEELEQSPETNARAIFVL